MSTKNRSLPILFKLFVATFALLGLVGAGIATAPAANADVFPSCTHSGCAEARDSNEIWASMGYPGSRGWYDWPDGQCNFAGGTHHNYEGQLPEGHSYLEFDVTPRACDAPRQSYRLVVDQTNGDVYFSPNHYGDFYLL